MIIKESKFEKAKRENEGKYKLGLFYYNENDKRFIVGDRWVIRKGDINFAHPKFRKILLYLFIGIILLNLIAYLIIKLIN
ncbi:hypothetical protein ACFLSE_01810 [Bacteroidota bacterium]